MTNMVDEIKRVYALEEAAGRMAVTLNDVPHNYRAITPQWLTELLCADVAGAEVVSLTLGEASTGSSNRQRIFVHYNDAGQRAGLPPSVFCKASQALDNRIMLGAAGTAQGEVNFFTKIRPRVDIEVPTPLHAAYDARTFAYILAMKDMTGVATFCDERTEIGWEQAVQAVTLLAKLHATFYEHRQLGSAAIPFMRWADWWKNLMEQSPGFSEACDLGFGLAEELIPARLFSRRSEIWPLTMASAELHRNLPATLIHCDVHLKNWYQIGGRMGLCDWQCVAIGHWSRDFIYAMTTMLSIENRRAWLADLLKIYMDAMAREGVPPINYDEALLLCRQQLPTALAFWTITLRPAENMPNMHPDSTTLTFIERMAAAIDDLDALDSFT